MAPAEKGCDEASVSLPIGGRALVVSDLFLGSQETACSRNAVAAIVAALAAVPADGALVVAGNAFDLLRGGEGEAGIEAALLAHPALAEAISAFCSEPGICRRVVFLPGVRDRAMLYGPAAAAPLRRLGAEVALAAEITVETGSGPRHVRVEAGWRYDTRSAFSRPEDPHDTPLAEHMLSEIFPVIEPGRRGWLADIERLQDPAGMPRFIASRTFYRMSSRWSWLLLLPLAAVVLGHLPGFWLYGMPSRLRGFSHLLLDIGVTFLLELLVIAGLLAYASRWLWRGAGRVLLGPPADRANDSAREAARSYVAGGGAGFVTGHSLQAEIGDVGGGFFANTGASSEVVEERPGLFGLPPVFAKSGQISLVTIEGGADLHARLTLSSEPQPATTRLERLAMGPRRSRLSPTVVGSYPGRSWPVVADLSRRRRLIRRLVAALVALIGAFDVVSAVVPPQLRGKLHPYLGYIPLGASAAAGALVALAGIMLVLLARGLRRGQRLAWTIAVVTIGLTAVLHIVREGQVLSSVASLVVLGALWWARDSFKTAYEPAAVRTALWTLLAGGLAVPLVATAALEIGVRIDRDHHRTLPLPTAFAAALERMVGINTIALPPRVAVFLNPAELSITIALVVIALLIGFRPVAARRLAASRAHHGEEPMSRAREIVARRGEGTLDYFALRSDKQYFFDRDGLVAYAVRNGVALVSPDPICPPEERSSLWSAFRSFADEKGWATAVLGAGEEWLAVYHSTGMRDLYIGDEAVVDVGALDLSGGQKKGLRQAVNRIARYGYTISFHDPAEIEPELAESLTELMRKSRRGGVERGFSMTLGRIFDPADRGLLLAVAHAPEGKGPVAFSQFVPAPGIGGYSLDLMRRDPDDHPNGLSDFVLVRTMEHLREAGCKGLGLNFAMMRAVVAGEAGDGIATRLERFVLKKMSDSMQIESLWRFNAKFDPRWLPRFVVWDSAEQSLAAALAIARAESFWELPVIGRFLVPAESSAASPGA